MELNSLINKVLEYQKDKSEKRTEMCCGKLEFNVPVNVIETDVVKIIYRDNNECEIERKKNDNPVIYRNEEQKIYRQHGEWKYVEYEMYKLAGLDNEAKELLKTNYKYDGLVIE